MVLRRSLVLLSTLLIFSGIATGCAGEVSSPGLDSTSTWVVDDTGLLSAEEATALSAELATFRQTEKTTVRVRITEGWTDVADVLQLVDAAYPAQDSVGLRALVLFDPSREALSIWLDVGLRWVFPKEIVDRTNLVATSATVERGLPVAVSVWLEAISEQMRGFPRTVSIEPSLSDGAVHSESPEDRLVRVDGTWGEPAFPWRSFVRSSGQSLRVRFASPAQMEEAPTGSRRTLWAIARHAAPTDLLFLGQASRP